MDLESRRGRCGDCRGRDVGQVLFPALDPCNFSLPDNTAGGTINPMLSGNPCSMVAVGTAWQELGYKWALGTCLLKRWGGGRRWLKGGDLADLHTSLKLYICCDMVFSRSWEHFAPLSESTRDFSGSRFPEFHRALPDQNGTKEVPYLSRKQIP